jgi:hypothetical protein
MIWYFASRLIHFTELSRASYTDRITRNSGVSDKKADKDYININITYTDEIG